MTNNEIATTAAEAQRFLSRVKEYEEARAKTADKKGFDYDSQPTRAALRRASLDLSMALSRMRRRY